MGCSKFLLGAVCVFEERVVDCKRFASAPFFIIRSIQSQVKSGDVASFLVRVDQERIVKRVPTSSHRVLLLQSRAMKLHKLFQLAYDVHACRMIPQLVIILEGDMCTSGNIVTNSLVTPSWREIHKRLSHLNFKNINKLVKQNLVAGLPSLAFSKDKTSSAYEKGKHHRASFKTKRSFSINKCLHIINVDLFGPVKPQSLNHNKYNLVILDEYSRFTWVFCLKKKSDAADCIISFIRKMENLNEVKVKELGSDNGTEFKNLQLEEFCNEKGISLNLSSPYTLEQNGVAERRNRNLIEAARTMLNRANLPKQFWGEYDEKADDGFFLGYSPVAKAFRVFNIRSQDMEETYHVIFNENDEAISQISAEGNAIYFNENISFPDDEFQEPKRKTSQGSSNTLNRLEHFGSTDNLESAKVQGGVTTRSRIRDYEAVLAHECLYVNFLSKVELKRLNEALKEEGWVIAMQEELNQFERNKVWTLVPVPYGKTIIGTKWIYRNKTDENGVVIKNKARLVTQGFRQKEWIDYDETFSPVARLKAISIFLAYAAYIGFMVYEIDVKSAFLNAEAEYVTTAGRCAQVLWIKSQLADYDVLYNKVPIFCDNTSVIPISNNLVLHSRTKHIDIRYHFIRDHILKGLIDEKKPEPTSIDLSHSSPLRLKYFSLTWKGIEINIAEIYFSDLVLKLTPGGKKGKEKNICYIRYLSIIMELQMSEAYADENLIAMKPHQITKATFKDSKISEVPITSHMRKVAKLPEKRLTHPSDDTGDKSSSRTSVQPVSHAKAKHEKRLMKKKITSSSEPTASENSLDATMSAEEQENQPQTADTTKEQEKIVKEAKSTDEENDDDEFVESSIKSLGNNTFEELNEPADESPYDTESEIKIAKRFRPLINTDDLEITPLDIELSDMEEDSDLELIPDDEVESFFGTPNSVIDEDDTQGEQLNKNDEKSDAKGDQSTKQHPSATEEPLTTEKAMVLHDPVAKTSESDTSENKEADDEPP
uniref:Retrovirus-related Pol polyprotein from transposon TNT 1-94 n=1 Tax=Tanacetum cinerariifolium TaxID=118510 RepID=A0A6L2LPL7_TANCI|nr:retrovirus-related Pol polyprotein from transposon TNT 1-94 [Tanacetum cinerariifolium]